MGIAMGIEWSAAFSSLLWMLALGGLVWVLSLPLRNASIVDSFWALFFVTGATAYGASVGASGERALLVALLLGVWAVRLSGYITWRNWGHGEDRRYQAIRARNQPHYDIKSLPYVFGFQALLAWIVAMPLMAALSSARPLGWLDAAGVALWLIGFLFESVGDWQLARFKANPANAGKVMDRGLWRYTRHPNYFGESLIWWGFWLLAVSAGHAWTAFAPIVMTVMLLRVSGVSLLEKDLQVRRPAYAAYMLRTNAFLPGLPRKPANKGDSA
jgi:steroid 5-alpha reductase family enzyme